jgi:hypothetical protein
VTHCFASIQDNDQFLQTTLRWWEKVTSKPVASGNEPFAVTPPSVFPTKKPADATKKSDDKAAGDHLKRDALPVFVVDPVDAYIIRSKPADLVCRVVGADKAYFTCNGEAMASVDKHKEEDKMEVIGDEVSVLQRGQCYDHYFLASSQVFGEKNGIFLKNCHVIQV